MDNTFGYRLGYVTGAAALIAFMITGCASIGPGTINRDQFQYSEAMSRAMKDQTLLNVVKLRYADMPVFLEVASVINSYSLESSITGGANFEPGDNNQTLGGGLRYTDRPTITYNPIQGEKFTKGILTPLPPSSVFFLALSGWPVDFVFRLTVREINGVKNISGTQVAGQSGSPEFIGLVQALRRIQVAGEMGMRMDKSEQGEVPLIFFNQTDDTEIQNDIDYVIRTLGLDPNIMEFRLVFGLPRNDKEIGLSTRSLLGILLEISNCVNVPPEHLEDGSAKESYYTNLSADSLFQPLLTINSGSEHPDNAYAAVQYKGHWFWIDGSDYWSKGLFTFTMLLFTLSETGGSQAVPIITVPTG